MVTIMNPSFGAHHIRSYCRKLIKRLRSDHYTHFGFQEVPEDEKAEKVHQVFANVAKSYDTMNDAMSFGLHRFWKDEFIRSLNPTRNTLLLDVAGGTGDIAFKFLNYRGQDQDRKATVCDVNEEMMAVGKEKANDLNLTDRISWVCGDAENLPFHDNNFSAYTIAFGIRNCTHIDRVLKEAFRVLQPGGRFLCLEFSRVDNKVLRKIYDTYSFQVIPVLGEVIAGDWNSYQYLVESIRKFPDQKTFANAITLAGFTSVTYTNLTFGTVAIHSGFKL